MERDDPSDDWPQRIASRRPSGVVVGLISPTRKQLGYLQSLRIPIVLLDPISDPNGELPSVGTTDWQGGYDAGSHLVECGYARFVVVSGVPRFRFGKRREEGFRQAIAELAPDAQAERIDSTWSYADSTSAIRAVFAADRTAAGVFALDDEMALSVYTATREMGLSIPGDLGVVGFNDEPRAALADPPLTSVRQPVQQIAEEAVELARSMPDGGEPPFERIELPTTLIVRGSTSQR